ncbi:MAG: DUF4276 family protein, partial [Magnetococcales bacterium]|nr:DUF4276 family protein [Magnetococcales bacterium]
TGERPLLLVDSEAEVAPGISPWTHLKNCDRWERPVGATEEQVHLMVQCMENWFLAEREKLAKFYNKGFHAASLPATRPIENARKEDVLNGLAQAARHTKRGGYSKGGHAFFILEHLNPHRVSQQAPWACRLFKTLEKWLKLPEKMECVSP